MSKRRLDQILSHYGYCSRSEARQWIRRGRVLVEGVPASAPEDKAEPASVLVDGAPIECPDGLLAVLHKPLGYVCSRDSREGPSVYDLLPERWNRRNPPVTTVGRLDKDATGVLLITDLGSIVQRLTSPRHHVVKVYEATLNGPAEPAWLELFASGTYRLPGESDPCLPARLELVQGSEVRLELTEGRFHQVKRMFACLGREVVRLHRSRFGEIGLDGLEPGQWRLVPLEAAAPALP